MPTIATAKTKLARKVPQMASNYQAGMERFFGLSSGALNRAVPVMGYKDVMKAGIEDKWEHNLKSAFGL
jgi:hypothetical protein